MRQSNERRDQPDPHGKPEITADSFPFSADLKELEDSLSMSFDEVMGSYRRDTRDVETPPEPKAAIPETSSDETARQLAEHVATYVLQMQNPLRKELEKLRWQADEYYRDNKSLAKQVRRLLSEKEQLVQTLVAYETEAARYRNLFGNIYLKL